jgi:replicative DNA helicase
MTPREFLNQPRRLRDLIRNLEDELRMLQAEADGMTGIAYDKDPVQVSLTQSGTEEYVLRMEELRESILNQKQKYNIIVIQVEKTIDELTTEREIRILKMRYLRFMEWKEIFSALQETQDVVYSLHKRALNHYRC